MLFRPLAGLEKEVPSPESMPSPSSIHLLFFDIGFRKTYEPLLSPFIHGGNLKSNSSNHSSILFQAQISFPSLLCQQNSPYAIANYVFHRHSSSCLKCANERVGWVVAIVAPYCHIGRLVTPFLLAFSIFNSLMTNCWFSQSRDKHPIPNVFGSVA